MAAQSALSMRAAILYTGSSVYNGSSSRLSFACSWPCRSLGWSERVLSARAYPGRAFGSARQSQWDMPTPSWLLLRQPRAFRLGPSQSSVSRTLPCLWEPPLSVVFFHSMTGTPRSLQWWWMLYLGTSEVRGAWQDWRVVEPMALFSCPGLPLRAMSPLSGSQGAHEVAVSCLSSPGS